MPDWISLELTAVFIACIALFFTGLQFHWQRQHDRLSVKPFLVASTVVDVESQNDIDVLVFRLRFENVGLGPALIQNVLVTLDGKETDFYNVGKDILSKIKNSQYRGMKFHGEYAVSQGASITACDLSCPRAAVTDGHFFARSLQGLAFQVTYNSMYKNETFHLSKEGHHILSTN